MSLLIKKKFKSILGKSNKGPQGERQILSPLHCHAILYEKEKYEIFDHSTISIHILAGKIQNCLAFRADPKMSDLDALIRL